MCGIAGFTHRNHQPDPELIRKATYSLVHRGPDQQGVFESPVVSLGAVRLRIIDLAGGTQPIKSDDGDSVIVFNGEIYNHAEIRQELEGLGHHFHSHCDTEVVLRAFMQWDIASFSRMRGMFGVALWKESERRLVLARDRMGIKPLYFHQRGEELYFGSELKAIFAHPEIERRISPEGLAHYLSLNYVPCPYTLVDGIRKLPPGHWMEWRDGKVSTGAWWELKRTEPRKLGLEDAKSELEGLLRASIKEHLISDVPLGIWASGGVDSSTILHYAAEASSSQLKTFSVGFPGRKFDESQYFRKVAKKYDTDHHEFELDQEKELPSAIAELAYYSDEPSADAGALPVWYLSKMSRASVTVALSGEGADELFGGYYTYLADRYAQWIRMVPSPLRSLGLSLMNHWPVSDEKISLEYKIKRFLKGSLLSPQESHFFWNGTFTKAERALLQRNGAATTPLVSGTRLEDFLDADQHYYLTDDILYKCDRMSMAHSLEVRPPFLDHRIVEFAESLPISLKVHGSKLKFVLKELMRGKLPDDVLFRKKEGFDIPAHHWFRGVLKPLLLETLSRENIERTGLFHWSYIEGILKAHFERRANYGYHLWGLLILLLWMKRWRIESNSNVTTAQSSFSSQR